MHDSKGALGTGLLHIPEEFVLKAVFDCLVGCLTLLSVQLTVLVLVEEFRDYVVSAANVAIAVEIERDVGNASGTALLLQLSVGLGLLTVGLTSRSVVILPPGGHLDGLVLQDVGPVVT